MAIRQPAVAGLFYPSRPDELERDVRKFLVAGDEPGPRSVRSCPTRDTSTPVPSPARCTPALTIPRRAIVLCPNHTGMGAPAALDPSDAWRTPLGDVPLARGLAERLLALAPTLEEDAEAHRREHSLEVQLPFLQVRRPDVEIVPVSLGEPSLPLCREVGEALATLVREEEDPPVVFASSDMNHYESREVGRAKDDLALARVEAIDAEGLFHTVLARSISMCGFLPATALLFAARALGASRAEVAARRDSGDETGDDSSVVGYAGVVIS